MMQAVREPVDSERLKLDAELRRVFANLGASWQLYLMQKAAVDAVITTMLMQPTTRLDA